MSASAWKTGAIGPGTGGSRDETESKISANTAAAAPVAVAETDARPAAVGAYARTTYFSRTFPKTDFPGNFPTMNKQIFAGAKAKTRGFRPKKPVGLGGAGVSVQSRRPLLSF